MSGGDKISQRKKDYYAKMCKLLSEYNKILVVTVDNVGSSHMQSIRKSIRGKGVILMGKNTLMRKAMREYSTKVNNGIEPLIPLIYGNVGMVFVKDDLQQVKTLLVNNTVGAYAKIGSISPTNVTVPKGDTGMDPSKTSFFQALAIQTKINKGKIEILNDVSLMKIGDKVGASQASLLQMLNIKPFLYGCKVQTIYDDGQVIPSALFEMNDNDILDKIRSGISRIAAISLQTGHPTTASIPHTVSHGYRNLVAIALATSYSFKQVESLKALLSDPEALKRAQAASSAAAAPAAAAPAAAAPAAAASKKKDDDDEDAGGGGMGGLFGDDDDGGAGGGMGGLFGDAEDE
eukprot:TRINITY_DN22950_c0_g1_i1.p1 TRINITY_DN22950_c0_g1~~TRINITY_DN22950_c0_g1_i1.p1  ORF type:complete len:347 (+),score=111.68 TRINITY_DN22950_c0_g1_i1:53-1093(+)